MPDTLPPIPTDDWNAHQADQFDRQGQEHGAAIADAQAAQQQADDAARMDFEQRAQAHEDSIVQAQQGQQQRETDDRSLFDALTKSHEDSITQVAEPAPAATNGPSVAPSAGPIAQKALGGVSATTVDLGQGKSGGAGYDHQQGLARVYRDALASGLDEEGARAAVAVAQTEGGMGGAQGDRDIGGSRGTFQLYFGGGQGDNFAAAHQMSKADADALLAADPHAANEWALKGYLGNAIREGRAKGLSGPALATYAQQHGQVSVSPERAGQNYQALFADGKVPFDPGAAGGPGPVGQPAVPPEQGYGGTPITDQPEDTAVPTVTEPDPNNPIPTSFGDAAQKAIDQAQQPDNPGLFFRAGLPFLPAKPVMPDAETRDKMLRGEPLDANDFLKLWTKATQAQQSTQPAAAESEGLDQILNPKLADLAGAPGVRLGTSEGGIGRGAERALGAEGPEATAKAVYGGAEDLASGINELVKAGIPKDLIQRAALSPPSNQLWGQFWKRARNFIADQGEAGKELAQKIHDWREVAETTAGDWATRMPTVRKLSRDEFAHFVDVAEGKATARNPIIAKAAEEWDAIRQEAWQRAKDAGLPVGHIEDYFPHMFEDSAFKGDGWRKSIDHLVASGQAANEAEAAKILRNLPDVVRNRRYGNLEAAREVDLPFYKRTADVLFGQGGYLEHAADRISQVEMFGQGDEGALRLLERIGEEGGNAGAARNAFNVSVGAAKYPDTLRQLSGAARRVNTVTQLSLSALTNATQAVNTATVAGFGPTLRNILPALRSADAAEYALKAGVTLDHVIQDVTEGNGLASRVIGKFTAPGFASVERFNRVLTFHTGVDFASEMAAKAATGDKRARTAIEKLGLDADRIVEQGGLTEADEIRAGRAMVERTQFKVGPQDLPYWTDHPLGKLVTQFKSFAYNQTAFVKREIIDEAVSGNPAPLARFLVAGYLAGAAQTELKNKIQGRESEKDPIKRTIQYYNAVGGLGLMGDVLRVAGGVTNINADQVDPDRVVSQAAGTALGPTFGRAVDVLGGVANATRGNPAQLERAALRTIPLVGTTLQNVLVPYRAKPETGVASGSQSMTPPKPPRAPSPPKPPKPGGR